jgi:hypothetical protein
MFSNFLILLGARSRNRTGTAIKPGDFKSPASTNSAIRAQPSSRDILPDSGKKLKTDSGLFFQRPGKNLGTLSQRQFV